MKQILISMTQEQQDLDLGPHELANNILVDFCCMPKLQFSLEESASYHGIPVNWYQLDQLRELAKQNYFTLIEGK